MKRLILMVVLMLSLSCATWRTNVRRSATIVSNAAEDIWTGLRSYMDERCTKIADICIAQHDAVCTPLKQCSALHLDLATTIIGIHTLAREATGLAEDGKRAADQRTALDKLAHAQELLELLIAKLKKEGIQWPLS